MPQKRKLLFRNASLPAIFSMSLVLFLVGLLMLTLLLARDLTTNVKESLSLTVLLDDNITNQQQERLKIYLDNADFIKSCEYISKQKALSEYIKAMGVNPEEILGENPLRATYEIKLLAQFANNKSVHKIEKKILNYKGVVKVNYQDNMIKLVNDNVQKLSVILLGLSIILLLISISLINNTIRLKIYSNRFLINTMKLVGAKSWFICKPYVRTGILQGVISALLGFTFLEILLFYFSMEFGVNPTIVKSKTLFIVATSMVLMGALFTAVSTYFSVKRYIKMKTNDIYLV